MTNSPSVLPRGIKTNKQKQIEKLFDIWVENLGEINAIAIVDKVTKRTVSLTDKINEIIDQLNNSQKKGKNG